MLRKIISAVLCITMILSLSSCRTDTGITAETTENNISSSADSVSDNQTEKDNSDTQILNFEMPAENEEIAVFDIENYGKVKIKLFPEQCPKGVENFKSLINDGYYDGVIFHRIIKDFMIQGGDPTGTGFGGNSTWGEKFKQEINDGLRHFSGAVSYATAKDKLNGSQFFIVTGFTDINSNFFSMYNINSNENVKKLYCEKGGYPALDGEYEVFGQVFEGLDICFEISKVKTDEYDKPVEDVIINSAKIEEYNPQ